MKKINKIKRKLKSKEYLYYLMIGNAILLSGIAAFFSVYGLSHLFVKARISVIIMASSLEACKVVSVSIYYRFKDILVKKVKIFLLVCIILLMCITSLGIYSYLTNAFQKLSDNVENGIKKEEIVNDQLKNMELLILNSNNRLKILQERYLFLINTNADQEKRLDTAVKELNYYTIKKTRSEIEQTNIELSKINKDITDLSIVIDDKYKDKRDLQTKLRDINNEIYSNDIGPLKFISRLFKVEIDVVVTVLIFVIIITFDPLAVTLIIIGNMIYVKKKEEKTNGKRKYKRRRRKRRRKTKNSDII